MPMVSQSVRPLRIVTLAHELRVAGGLSVGRNMVASLGRMAPEHKYLFTIPIGLGYEDICARIPGSVVKPCEHKGGLLRRWTFLKFELPKIVREFNPDLLFALGGAGMQHPPCPQIAFPQMAHVLYPVKQAGIWKLSVRVKRLYWREFLRRQFRNTQLVLCQTEVVADRIRRVMDYRGRTLVCSSAVSPFMREGQDDAEMPEPLKPYGDKMKLFYLAKYYPHKNFERIVKLFHKHKQELQDVVVFITIGPGGGALAEKLLGSISRLGLQDRIVNLGVIPHELTGNYYRSVDALLMPTLLETFGLPYLEAMNYGLPILTSDLDFAHSVCGDAALYFDPWDIRSMRDAILRLKNDSNLREQLAGKAKARSTGAFRSWDEIAGEVAGLFPEIAGCESGK